MLRLGRKLLRRPSLPLPPMIPLHRYARHVYQHAPAATTEHLHHTVWGPLGLAAEIPSSGDRETTTVTPEDTHVSLYATPPITTNIRCVGADITTEMRTFLQSASTTAAANGVAAAQYVPPFTLDPLGLPFCACVQPRAEHLSPVPPAAADGGGSVHSSSDSPTTGAPSTAAPVVVVVDAGAAEAVLRGSDLYAPGIITANRVFVAGEAAVVAFYFERVDEDGEGSSRPQQQQQQMKKMKGEAVAAQADASSPSSSSPVVAQCGEGNAAAADGETGQQTEGSFRASAKPWRLVSNLTAGSTLPQELYDPLPDAPSALADRRHFLVCVASGMLLMGWRDVLGRRTRGVALRTEWSPQLQPSRATLRSLFGLTPANTTAGAARHTEAPPPPDAFFLQNYSSMVPVSLLVDHLPAVSSRRPRSVVLDACAAPGGKTSLLLSLLQARSTANGSDTFRVVCCERSRPRQAQLMALLQEHFAHASEGFLSRVLEPHCIDTNKYLKRLLLGDVGSDGTCSGGGDAATCEFTDTFDAILLDPPCTGLGLRPKLLPHPHTVASIQHSADYQRKLFDSCVRHLRGTPTTPGVLVYSTCTTSCEENEANVLHFLRSYPGLRLARATTAAHDALCALSVTTYSIRTDEAAGAGGDAGGGCGGVSPLPRTAPRPPQLLLSREILAAQLAKEAALSGTVVADAARSDAPLLALRFMPRPLAAYTDVCEDSVGFFVAVFLFCGHHQPA